MIKHFIYHKWKESIRSSVFQKNLVVNIILGLFILYFVASFALLGFFVDVILEERFPEANIIFIFNGFLLYYFGTELILRLQLQELPVMSVQPYMHLPIDRKNVVHYLLFQNFTSLFNYFPLLIFIPFSIKAILPEYGVLAVFFWLGSVVLFSLFINYLITFVKRKTADLFWAVPAVLLLFASIAFLDYSKIIELSAVSELIFNSALNSPILLIVVLCLLALAYYANFVLVYNNTYLDEIGKKSKKQAEVKDYSFFERFGQIGQLINLEIKLILRNKRSKSVVYTSSLFILYGLVFYTNEFYLEGNYMLIFAGIFITGMFMMNYGQFIPSWESSYFDGVLTSNIESEQYFLSKYYLFLPTSLVAFILSLPYAYFSWKLVFINFTMMLFNIGINAIMVLFFSTYNNRRIDLSKKAVLNWEGVGASQFIMIIPALLLPIGLFFPFEYFLSPTIGYVFLGSISVLSLIFHRYWIKLIARRFDQQKYKIAAGFRKE